MVELHYLFACPAPARRPTYVSPEYTPLSKGLPAIRRGPLPRDCYGVKTASTLHLGTVWSEYAGNSGYDGWGLWGGFVEDSGPENCALQRNKSAPAVLAGADFDFKNSLHPRLVRYGCWWAGDHDRLAALLAAAEEVDRAVDAPDGGDRQGDIRLLPAHTIDGTKPIGDGADEVEDHAQQVRQQAEQRDEFVLEEVVEMVLMEGNHRDNATHHIEKERTKVADERNRQEALRDLGGQSVVEQADLVEEILRQSIDDAVRLRPAHRTRT